MLVTFKKLHLKNLMKISLVLGIDIGGTNTIYGFITKNGTIVFQEEILTNGDKSISDLVDRIGKRVENFSQKTTILFSWYWYWRPKR